MKKIFSLLLLLVSFATNMFAGDAEFKKSWVDSFGYENDVWGRYVHAGFVINGCKGQNCKFIVYIKDDKGNYIKDKLGKTVSFSKKFIPNSADAKFHDFRIFCPLSSMNITSSNPQKTYYFVVYIRDANNKFIGNSTSMKITY